MSTYGERDGQRVVLLRSDDGGDTWSPDVSAGGVALAASQQRFDVSDTVVYVGSAVRGADGADPVWTVKRIELDNNNPTSIQWATNVAWDDRTSEEYS